MLTSCASALPWHDEPIGNETNLAFRVEKNLLYLLNTSIDGRPGRYIFGSASVRSVLDPRIAGTDTSHRVFLGSKNSVAIRPAIIDLRGVADGIVGADSAGGNAITIDYRSQLVTVQKEGIHPELMTLYSYTAEPSVNVNVDGADLSAVVDTALPDTIVLPRAKPSRGTAHVILAGIDFGTIDVQYANVSRPRIGNRLLSRFLVSIDYGKRVVGLWYDTR
ncbi:MAG TPA: hypothetical protein VMU84_21015 [Thermoanaerobaculia bacterium]|nr:hypothetical protein [Thermoanaerobaculia bacterium]